MKASLTLAIIVLAGMLVSCQQAFVDSAAKTNGGAPSASLSSPSFGPGDTTFTGITAPFSSIEVTDAGGTAYNMAQDVVNFLTASLIAGAPSSAPGVSTGTGLPGYILLTSDFPSYDITTDTGDSEDSSNVLAGSYSSSVQDYEETSPAYDAELSSSGSVKLFRKAVHRLYSTSVTYTVKSNVAGTEYSGTLVQKQRSEWYKDILTGTSGYSLQYGITEYSFDFAISYSSGVSKPIGGKFVGSARISQPYSGDSSTVSDRIPSINITVKQYGTNNEIINTDVFSVNTSIDGPSDSLGNN